MVEKEINLEKPHNNVHHALAHSYFSYFFASMLGVLFDILFPLNLFPGSGHKILGLCLLFLSSFLIFWAQHTSRKLHKGDVTKESFAKGPYKYTRTPTHMGLFFLTIGLGFVLNTFFLVLFSFTSFLFTRLTYIKKQEKILHKKYGEPYDQYKNSVRF